MACGSLASLGARRAATGSHAAVAHALHFVTLHLYCRLSLTLCGSHAPCTSNGLGCAHGVVAPARKAAHTRHSRHAHCSTVDTNGGCVLPCGPGFGTKGAAKYETASLAPHFDARSPEYWRPGRRSAAGANGAWVCALWRSPTPPCSTHHNVSMPSPRRENRDARPCSRQPPYLQAQGGVKGADKFSRLHSPALPSSLLPAAQLAPWVGVA